MKTALEIANDKLKNLEIKDEPMPQAPKKVTIGQDQGVEIEDELKIVVNMKRTPDGKEYYKWKIPQNLKDSCYLLNLLERAIDKKQRKENRWYKLLWKRLFNRKIGKLGKIICYEKQVEFELSVNEKGKVVIPKDLRDGIYLSKIVGLAINRQMMILIAPVSQPTDSALRGLDILGNRPLNRAERRRRM